jgi:anti-sigma factor RsiW
MRCDKAERYISDGLDGVLEGARAKRLEAHLAACPSCRARKASLERLQTVARTAAPATPNPERLARSLARLKAGIQEQAASKPFPYRHLGLRWIPAGAAATLLVAAAGLYLVFLRPAPAVDFVPYAYSEAGSGLVLSLEGDEELAAAVDVAIGDALIENGASATLAGLPLEADAGRFIDSLTDEEVLLLEAVIPDQTAL